MSVRQRLDQLISARDAIRSALIQMGLDQSTVVSAGFSDFASLITQIQASGNQSSSESGNQSPSEGGQSSGQTENQESDGSAQSLETVEVNGGFYSRYLKVSNPNAAPSAYYLAWSDNAVYQMGDVYSDPSDGSYNGHTLYPRYKEDPSQQYPQLIYKNIAGGGSWMLQYLVNPDENPFAVPTQVYFQTMEDGLTSDGWTMNLNQVQAN